VPIESFAAIAAQREPTLDQLSLALAAEFRDVDPDPPLATLDELAAEVGASAGDGAAEEVEALRAILGGRHGFVGDQDEYDHPDNSMLDLVLERRRGLPILLSVVYVEVARRAGITVAGVGLPGHYVVGHFGEEPPLLLDPFRGGAPLEATASLELVRTWGPHETALRMINNLVGSYLRRADLVRAIRAAELRLELPLGEAEAAALGAELRSLRARFN
jgi:regulator of sirC expression with transglutaminase-like and TPR domain